MHCKRVRDMTKRKRIEREMQSLAKFPSENPNPVLRLSREGVVLYANEAGEPILRMWNMLREAWFPKRCAGRSAKRLRAGLRKPMK